MNPFEERESEEKNEKIIIAFIGRKFSGKDSVANVWKKFVNRVTNFAIPLKDDCIKKYDMDRKWFYDPGLKEEPFSPEIIDSIRSKINKNPDKFPSEIKDRIEKNKEIHARHIMMNEADMMKEKQGDDIYARKLAKKLSKENNKIVLVTDMRYLKEIEAMDSMESKLYIVRIIGNHPPLNVDPNKISNHSSEIELDDYTAFYTVDNTETLLEFERTEKFKSEFYILWNKICNT